MTKKIVENTKSRIYPAATKYIVECQDPERRQVMESVARSYFTAGEQVNALKQIVQGYRALNPQKKTVFTPKQRALLEKRLAAEAAKKIAAHNSIVVEQAGLTQPALDNELRAEDAAVVSTPGGVIRTATLYMTGAIPRDAEGTYIVEMKNGVPTGAWKLAPAGYRLSFWRRVRLVFEVLFMKGNKP